MQTYFYKLIKELLPKKQFKIWVSILNKKIILCIGLLFLFLSTNIISPCASSKNLVENDDSNQNLKLIMLLLKLRFRLGYLENIYSGKYFYLQYKPPVAIQAYPDAIDLSYLNETIFQIGGKNPDTQEWETMIKVAGGWDWAWWNPQIIFYFEFVPPEDSPPGAWNVQFDPPQVLMRTNKENLNWPGAEDPFKTNIKIMLKPSEDATYPTHDVVLKFNIVREEILDKARIRSGAPKWADPQNQEYIEKQLEVDPDKTPYWSIRGMKFLYNIQGTSK